LPPGWLVVLEYLHAGESKFHLERKLKYEQE
jgi:hypothetical protein